MIQYEEITLLMYIKTWFIQMLSSLWMIISCWQPSHGLFSCTEYLLLLNAWLSRTVGRQSAHKIKLLYCTPRRWLWYFLFLVCYNFWRHLEDKKTHKMNKGVCWVYQNGHIVCFVDCLICGLMKETPFADDI